VLENSPTEKHKGREDDKENQIPGILFWLHIHCPRAASGSAPHAHVNRYAFKEEAIPGELETGPAVTLSYFQYIRSALRPIAAALDGFPLRKRTLRGKILAPCDRFFRSDRWILNYPFSAHDVG
jgi:hypothetical protein